RRQQPSVTPTRPSRPEPGPGRAPDLDTGGSLGERGVSSVRQGRPIADCSRAPFRAAAIRNRQCHCQPVPAGPNWRQRMKKRFYITTAIDYVNGQPHVGHAYEKILADVIARARRSLGEEVFFL